MSFSDAEAGEYMVKKVVTVSGAGGCCDVFEGCAEVGGCDRKGVVAVWGEKTEGGVQFVQYVLDYGAVTF